MSRLKERLENYNKALNILQKSVDAYNFDKQNEVTHMALIQSFEVCFELGWKTMKDFLEHNKIIVKFPKEVIKEAFLFDIVPTGQIWIDMLNDRNISSYEYNMEKVNKILEKIAAIYFNELKDFYNRMEAVNG